MRRLALALLAVITLAGCNAETDPASHVSETTAQANVTMTWEQGEKVTYWIETRPLGGSWTQGKHWTFGPMPIAYSGAVGAFPLSDLQPATTYEYRLCGQRLEPDPTATVCFDSEGANGTAYDRFTTDGEPTGCTPGATNVTTAAALRSAVAADRDACVTANIGNVNLAGLGSSPVVISGPGSMGTIELIDGTTDVTIRDTRLTSITMRFADRTVLKDNVMGGTPTNRTQAQIIWMPEASKDVTITGNELAWTTADNSGNTGYGCRCYGDTDNLVFRNNYVHDLAADGFQGSSGSNVIIDRNEFGAAGASPGSSEHADNIQITGNGPGMEITNNYVHHQGYFDGKPSGNSGVLYVHGGSSGSLLIENNLFITGLGRVEIGGLGTGGRTRSNVTIRRNTFYDLGTSFQNFPGFEWDITGGTGNVIRRNIAADPDGGFALSGSLTGVDYGDNLWGGLSSVTLDADGNCTSANCNPPSGPIGYRKPSGVAW